MNRITGTLRCPSARIFELWLRQNHDVSQGVWLEIAKPGAPEPTVGYEEALEAALCYGWIDGQKKAGETSFYWLQRFTPRRSRSMWSKANRARAEALIGAGRMEASG
ncbi:bacteriocin-protection protein [Roseateles depolymerans]|uniref:Bacteriocin-protection protein n=1 Tax=Roseateles depolymerans TaxID=76731 RepID=A0A0U3N4Q3_9BURK|nr:bacteriocin-protection protein [Roseateles depolymerans]